MDGWMETILFFDFGYRGDSFSQIFENYPNKTKILVGDRANMSIHRYRYLRLEVP
jgi:predicted phosphoadenosine phosphosulfate sulfurtransferase